MFGWCVKFLLWSLFFCFFTFQVLLTNNLFWLWFQVTKLGISFWNLINQTFLFFLFSFFFFDKNRQLFFNINLVYSLICFLTLLLYLLFSDSILHFDSKIIAFYKWKVSFSRIKKITKKISFSHFFFLTFSLIFLNFN